MSITVNYLVKVSSKPTVISCFGAMLYNQNFISPPPTFHCSYPHTPSLLLLLQQAPPPRAPMLQLSRGTATLSSLVMLLPSSTAIVPGTTLEHHDCCCNRALSSPLALPSSTITAHDIVLKHHRAVGIEHHRCPWCHPRAPPSLPPSSNTVVPYIRVYLFRGVSLL